MANNGQPEEEKQVEVNLAPLIEAQKHLNVAVRLLLTQPPVHPLDSVRMFATGASAILTQALAEAQSRTQLVVAPPGLKIGN